jgi:hypothetical protein
MPPKSSTNAIRKIMGLPPVRKSTPFAEPVTITPAMAEELLKYQSNVRRTRQPVIDNIAEDMRRGWQMTGETIIYDRDGLGRNGEHRLRGCIQAGVPFQTMVSFNVDPNTVLNMDRGAKREFRDFLAGELGLTNASALASSVRLAYQLIEHGDVDQSRTGLTNEVLYTWYLNGHEPIAQDLMIVKQWWTGWPKGFTVTHATAILHAARFVKPKVDHAKVVAFFQAMGQSGDLVGQREAPRVLYRTFESMRNNSKSGRIQQPDAVGTTIKALNMYLAGEEVPANERGQAKAGMLQWRRDTTFPKIGQ